MKFKIVPIKHDGGYKWELQRESVVTSWGWQIVGCYTWKWQARRMARHLSTAEEVLEV